MIYLQKLHMVTIKRNHNPPGTSVIFDIIQLRNAKNDKSAISTLEPWVIIDTLLKNTPELDPGSAVHLVKTGGHLQGMLIITLNSMFIRPLEDVIIRINVDII